MMLKAIIEGQASVGAREGYVFIGIVEGEGGSTGIRDPLHLAYVRALGRTGLDVT